jgi:hypothetical protein
MAVNLKSEGCVDLCPPTRNRYFYGKLLDVFHFELEQKYFNSKRWMLNRLVSGYGVVCGLGVQLGPDNQSVVVLPGIAIDRCGREIIVCQKSDPLSLPAPPAPPANQPPSATPGAPGTTVPTANPGGGVTLAPPPPQPKDCDCGPYVHLSICYHECQADPVPALGGDCDTQSACSPGAIRERYSLTLCDGQLPPARTTTRIPNMITNGAINYGALANYVTNACAPCGPDCCIPLANIRVPDPGQTYDANSIDINPRPIEFSNDLLYEMILALIGQPQPNGGK